MLDMIDIPHSFHHLKSMDYYDSISMRTSRMKRDRASIVDVNDIDETHIQKRILLDLESLSLHPTNNLNIDQDLCVEPSSSSSVGIRNDEKSKRDITLEESDDIDRLVTSPFFSSHKRYFNKADELFENIIRKSRRMTESSIMMNDCDEGLIPASVGPHPATDMQIGLYWPTTESQLALIVPNITRTVSRPTRRNQRLKTIDEDEEDDSSDLLHTPMTRSSYKTERSIDLPRFSGDSTHAGIIEVVSDLSSSSDESMSQITMETNEAEVEDTRMDNQSVSSLSDDDDDDVIDILTVA